MRCPNAHPRASSAAANTATGKGGALRRVKNFISVRATGDRATTAIAVRSIGRNRTAPASTTASVSGMPSASRSSMKSTRMIELRTTMPAPAMKPIIDVAVKKARAYHRPIAADQVLITADTTVIVDDVLLIDLHDPSPGVYLLTIRSKELMRTARVIVE